MTKTNIYVIKGKNKYYVGKADNINRRFSQHKSQAKKGNSIKDQWILDCGNNLRISSIEKVDSSKWREREQFHIASYQRKYGKNNVMNSTRGGDGPKMIDEESPSTDPGCFTSGIAFLLILSGLGCFMGGIIGIIFGIFLMILGAQILTST